MPFELFDNKISIRCNLTELIDMHNEFFIAKQSAFNETHTLWVIILIHSRCMCKTQLIKAMLANAIYGARTEELLLKWMHFI